MQVLKQCCKCQKCSLGITVLKDIPIYRREKNEISLICVLVAMGWQVRRHDGNIDSKRRKFQITNQVSINIRYITRLPLKEFHKQNWQQYRWRLFLNLCFSPTKIMHLLIDQTNGAEFGWVLAVTGATFCGLKKLGVMISVGIKCGKVVDPGWHSEGVKITDLT